MTREQILAQALFDLEMELDLHESDTPQPFLDKLWEIIHADGVWEAVMDAKPEGD